MIQLASQGTLWCIVLCVFFGVASLRRWRSDRAAKPAPYHLMHGPKDGCWECEGK